MKNDIDKKSADFLSKSRWFRSKSDDLKQLICQAIEILEIFGIPFDKVTARRLERMALAFLTVAGKDIDNSWSDIKDLSDSVSLKTRDIIKILNDKYEESISSGSYDDIRRKDLKLLVLGKIILPSNPDSARNDSTRGYALNPLYAKLLRKLTSGVNPRWKSDVQKKLKDKKSVRDLLSSDRDIQKIPVKLPSGEEITFSPGKHNLLQKAIIEELLPRYGYGCEILYVGDTANKSLYKDESKLKKLNFFELSHGELPDIIAYSENKNWLYLIEAVHSSGPVSDIRLLELRRLAKKCKADIIFITAFLNRETFQKFVKELAWETEIWIAESPDHIIHFDGEKFLEPHKNTE
ncbi:BsuBI/PstI family type II restriction endonuclease [Desulfobacterales bacterium HSG2]|nr:BsuBI/PstI family type II restriction endonuclease [Desulfobacterales bacterium HSG2]